MIAYLIVFFSGPVVADGACRVVIDLQSCGSGTQGQIALVAHMFKEGRKPPKAEVMRLVEGCRCIDISADVARWPEVFLLKGFRKLLCSLRERQYGDVGMFFKSADQVRDEIRFNGMAVIIEIEDVRKAGQSGQLIVCGDRSLGLVVNDETALGELSPNHLERAIFTSIKPDKDFVRRGAQPMQDTQGAFQFELSVARGDGDGATHVARRSGDLGPEVSAVHHVFHKPCKRGLQMRRHFVLINTIGA